MLRACCATAYSSLVLVLLMLLVRSWIISYSSSARLLYTRYLVGVCGLSCVCLSSSACSLSTSRASQSSHLNEVLLLLGDELFLLPSLKRALLVNLLYFLWMFFYFFIFLFVFVPFLSHYTRYSFRF